MLTLVLLRLEARLDEFCALVANPTTENVSAAADLLEQYHRNHTVDDQSNEDSASLELDPRRSSSYIDGRVRNNRNTASPLSSQGDSSVRDNMSSLSAPNSPTTRSLNQRSSPRLSPTLSKLRDKQNRSIFVPSSSRVRGRSNVIDFVSLSPNNHDINGNKGKSSKYSPNKTLVLLKSAFASPIIMSQRAISSVISMSDRSSSGSGSYNNRLNRNQQEGSWFMSPVLNKYTQGYFSDRGLEENEWQKFVSPFLIFAGCEAVFGRMEHVCSTSDKILLSRYKEVLDSLHDVKQLLCNPLLREPISKIPQDHHESSNSDIRQRLSSFTTSRAAFSLSNTVSALESLIHIRIKQVNLHMKLFFTDWSTDDEGFIDVSYLLSLANESKLIDDSLSCISTNETTIKNEAIHPIINSSVLESRAFTYALMAYSSLHKCLYFETILAARRLKVSIEKLDEYIEGSCKTLQSWLKSVHYHIKVKMGLIFDRIDACSKLREMHNDVYPNERKDETLCRHQSELKNDINDFLWKCHQRYGQLTTFAIIFHAGKIQPCFEKGFISDSNESPVVDGLQSWPAIFLRSNRCVVMNENSGQLNLENHRRRNLHSLDEANMNSISSEKDGEVNVSRQEKKPHRRMVTAQADLSSYIDRKTSFSMILDAVTDGGKATDIHFIESERQHEYWLASTEWPNFLWHAIVSLLTETKKYKTSKATTFRDVKPDDHLDIECRDSTTAFHYVRIAGYLWLMIMVREENLKRKHRTQSDEEIISFMDGLASKLRFQTLLNREAVIRARSYAESHQGKDEEILETTERSIPCFFC